MTPQETPIGPVRAAALLGVSTRTVQRWLREGRLPAVRVGGRLKVDPVALAAVLESASGIDRTPERGTSAGERAHLDGAAAVPEGADGSAVAAGAGGAVARAVVPNRARRRAAPRPIRRLLVANRGELVPRIARTCRTLGIRCLALVAPDQAGAWWTTRADETIPLDGDYLDPRAVLGAAHRSGADAIHPGYGFLAENADFADAVAAAGFTWIGPPAIAMRALGDKAAARRLARSADVPVLPGYDGDDQSDEALSNAAGAVGFPVLIKPSGGGGGKGMHVVREPAALADAIARARREAGAAFGDQRLILERFVERPRHVEVQFLADRHGGAVHLLERDCSLQRRHQKVIEEAPSPAVDAALRARLGDAALRLAGAAGYIGAGTAEFLLDDHGDVFFLEVNARLQVEHPVTEAITGRDLVADQVRMAAGEPLGFEQADVNRERPRHRGAGLRGGPVVRLPAGDRARRRGPLAVGRRGSSRCRRRRRGYRRHPLRPAACQDRRARRHARAGTGAAGRGPRGHDRPRRHDEPRVPPPTGGDA